jgi:uncharacterized protein (TIGR03437 family)
MLRIAIIAIAFFLGTQAPAQTSFLSISAASYTGTSVARGSIVAGFGQNLTSQAIDGSGQLPTSLGGVSVSVTDSSGAQQLVPLLFVSPGQINYLLPSTTTTGAATASVIGANGATIASAALQVTDVAPGFFTALGSGQGVAAGVAVVQHSSGSGDYVQTFQCLSLGCVAVPISLVAGDQVAVELYGTGIRNVTSAGNVTATASGQPASVLYAGPSTFPGEDQVNVLIPANLSSGMVVINVSVNGIAANPVLLGSTSLPTSAVSVLFDPSTPSTGPFPTNFLTTPDTTQKTGLRANIPVPDCTALPTDCQVAELLNQLDGFDLQPRINVGFSAPVDTTTLTSGIWFVWLNNLTNDEPGQQAAGHVTKINEAIYDPTTNALYAKPDEPFDQHRNYALIVTDAVHDSSGNSVGPDPAFSSCLGNPQTSYCAALSQAVALAAAAVPSQRIVAASLFTTLSATSWLESARAAIASVPPNALRFGNPSVSKLSSIVEIQVNLQNKTNPSAFQTTTLTSPTIYAPGVGQVAFGSYSSPNFLNASQTIAANSTGSPVAAPAVTNQIYYHVYEPSSAKPAAGYPVIIYGHGLGDSSYIGPTIVSGQFAQQGFATIAINAVGHGYGPQSSIALSLTNGQVVHIPEGGRGIDLNGDGTIDDSEGCLITAPAVAFRDCERQTAVDLLQLVRAIQGGLDLDGDGTVDLDPNHIYFAGESFGSFYGTLLSAVEPAIRGAVLNVAAGSVIDVAYWSVTYHTLATSIAAAHVPSLLNAGTDINPDYVFRDQPVKVEQVAGAIDIQNYFERLEWLQASGDPMSFAPHLKTSPLAGDKAKSVLFQIAQGDQTVTNPANSNLIRQANGQANTVMYLYNTAKANAAGLSGDPHTYLVNIVTAAGLAVADATQAQIAGFLASDGATIPNANTPAIVQLFQGNQIFQLAPPLPETLNF